MILASPPLAFTDLQVSSPVPLLKSSFSEVEWEYVDFGFFGAILKIEQLSRKIHLETNYGLASSRHIFKRSFKQNSL